MPFLWRRKHCLTFWFLCSGRSEGPFLPHRHPPSILIPERRAHHRRVGLSGLQPRRTRNVARAPTRCVLHTPTTCLTYLPTSNPSTQPCHYLPLSRNYPPNSSIKRAEDPHRHPNMRLPRLPCAVGAARRASGLTPHPAVLPCVVTRAGTRK
jgi:hypothetical protein